MSHGSLTAASAARGGHKTVRRASWRIAEQPLLWLAPLALLLLVSYVYPAIEVVRFSFTDATLLNPEYAYSLGSYENVGANPDLPGVIRTTLVFVVFSVVLQLTLGLLVAMALNRGTKRKLWVSASYVSSSSRHGSCRASPAASSGS